MGNKKIYAVWKWRSIAAHIPIIQVFYDIITEQCTWNLLLVFRRLTFITFGLKQKLPNYNISVSKKHQRSATLGMCVCFLWTKCQYSFSVSSPILFFYKESWWNVNGDGSLFFLHLLNCFGNKLSSQRLWTELIAIQSVCFRLFVYLLIRSK